MSVENLGIADMEALDGRGPNYDNPATIVLNHRTGKLATRAEFDREFESRTDVEGQGAIAGKTERVPDSGGTRGVYESVVFVPNEEGVLEGHYLEVLVTARKLSSEATKLALEAVTDERSPIKAVKGHDMNNGESNGQTVKPGPKLMELGVAALSKKVSTVEQVALK